MSLTSDEAKILLENLSTRLNNTSGDKETVKALNQVTEAINQSIRTLETNKEAASRSNATLAKSIASNIRSNGGFNATSNPKNSNIDKELANWNKAFGDTRQSVTDLDKSLRGATGSVSMFGKGMDKVSTGIGNTISGLSKLDGTVTSFASVATSMISGFALGRGVGIVLKSLTSTVDTAIDSYRSLTNAGQNLGGNLLEISKIANQNGMKMEDFTKALLSGSQGLKQFGGRNFAEASNRLRIATRGFSDLGMNMNSVNDALSDYAEMQRVSGSLEELNTKGFVNTFQTIIKNGTSLAGAFGTSRDEILKAAADLKKSPEIAALTQNLSRDAQDRVTQFLGAIKDDTLRERAKEALGATQGDYSERYAQLMVSAPDLMSSLERVMSNVINGGSLQESLEDLKKSGRAQADQLKGIPSAVLRASGQYGQDTAAAIIASNAASNINLENAQAGEQLDKQTPLTQQALMLESTMKSLEVAMEDLKVTTIRSNEAMIASMLKFTNDSGKAMADFSKNLTESFLQGGFKGLMEAVNKGLADLGISVTSVTSFFKSLGSVISGENGTLAQIVGIGIAATGAIVAMKAIGGLVTMISVAQKVLKFMIADSAPGGGGGLDIGGPGSKGGAGKGNFWKRNMSRLGRLGKLGAVGALITGGIGGYMDWTDADEQFAAGEITETERDKKKTEAVGGAAGSVTGALGGAAAGAAVGSIVPGIGTAVGGALGFVGGGIGGYFGKDVGKEIADVVYDQFIKKDDQNGQSIPTPKERPTFDNIDPVNKPEQQQDSSINSQTRIALNDKKEQNDTIENNITQQTALLQQMLTESKRQPLKDAESTDKILEALYTNVKLLERVAFSLDRISNATG